MATEQMRRDVTAEDHDVEQMRTENITDELAVHLEKDRVPKMTRHFESLAGKEKGSDVPTGGVSGGHGAEGGAKEGREGHEEAPKFESIADKVGGLESAVRGDGQWRKGEGKEKVQIGASIRGEVAAEGGGREEREGLSLDEISEYQKTAQQNSVEAIRRAEERYATAKEHQQGASSLQNVKESTRHGLGAATAYATEKGEQTKDTILQGAEKGSQYVSEKGKDLKNSVLEKVQQGKDTLARSTKTAADYTSSAAGQTKNFTVQKAVEAKDGAVELGKTAASYAREKAVAAKAVTVEKGKSAAGYAGKLAEEVKERAAVAGWVAAHYTCEKAEEAAKAVAGVAASAAGYAGEKLAAATDAVEATEASAMEYTAKKKAATETELLEANKKKNL